MYYGAPFLGREPHYLVLPLFQFAGINVDSVAPSASMAALFLDGGWSLWGIGYFELYPTHPKFAAGN